MGDIPLSNLVIPPIVFSTLPAVVMSIFFGGRGVLIGLIALLVAVMGYLFWGFVLAGVSMDTGLEGLALFVLPMFWMVFSAWSGLVYVLVRWLGYLPHQRSR